MNKGVTLSLKELRSPLYDAKLDITLGLEMLKQSFNGCTSDICVCVCVYTYIYICMYIYIVIKMTWKHWYIVVGWGEIDLILQTLRELWIFKHRAMRA